MSVSDQKYKTWRRDRFLISTNPSLISIESLADAFRQDWMYWAKPLPPSAMIALVRNSLNFGLYTPTQQTSAAMQNADAAANSLTQEQQGTKATSSNMIGYARVITDEVTFAYLTDVYVLPEWRREGLGKWLIECVQEWMEMLPNLRRSMLITSKDGPAVRFYETLMKMEKLEGGKLLAMSWRGPGSSV